MALCYAALMDQCQLALKLIKGGHRVDKYVADATMTPTQLFRNISQIKSFDWKLFTMAQPRKPPKKSVPTIP